MRITVTYDDIMSGYAGSCKKCPIALAAKRASGERNVAVASGLRIGTDYYRLPGAAFEFMVDFDMKITVYPFSFIATSFNG